MPPRDIHRAAFTSIIAAAIAPGLRSMRARPPRHRCNTDHLRAWNTRLLPDTDAVTSARAALDANPRNITRIIDLGVAQSGAWQFREAIATFTRGSDST